MGHSCDSIFRARSIARISSAIRGLLRDEKLLQRFISFGKFSLEIPEIPNISLRSQFRLWRRFGPGKHWEWRVSRKNTARARELLRTAQQRRGTRLTGDWEPRGRDPSMGQHCSDSSCQGKVIFLLSWVERVSLFAFIMPLHLDNYYGLKVPGPARDP